MSLLAPTLQAFFSQRLIVQKNASPHTIASYRDCWRLLLRFAQDRTGTPPARLSLEQLDAPMIGAFLDYLEHERGLSITSRNTRLAAVHSLFRFAALRHPEHAALIGRVLAIPAKRGERAPVCFLTPDEVDALLASPDRSRWTGRRDHALLLLAVQTGLRVSELTSLRIRDLALSNGAHVRCTGKGRKDRATPLTRQTAAVLRVYLAERHGKPEDPLFPGPAGSPLSTDAVRRLVERHAAGSARHCPSLGAKHVSPHVLRHTCAMRMQGRGVASDATFRSSREHALPAAQRAALRRPGLLARRRGCGDLGLHSPPGPDATMMRLMPLRGVHHCCACWHRDASGYSRLHRAHHRRSR